MASSSHVSAIWLYNHQSAVKVAQRWLRAVAAAALPECVKAAKSADAPLLQLTEIEVSVVSDEAIAQVHGEFMDDPSPTDVITFHHGEILVSADTARRQGAEHDQTTDREIALYIIHGLLHLAGWSDKELPERDEMHRLQEEILSRVCADVD